ncbi:MAG: ABC transporter permease [Planctomycetes bacterium]|nr:ABC transporter permease [Planctomycetota bacterium]
MPLLAKDLAEQAARRRTYVVRVVYAALLFAIFLIASYQEFERAGVSPFSEFSGSGRWMFEALVVIQFAGILLFLPATMSGAITYEKERGSLALLLLTTLRPWSILMQKYLGRLVPMFTFLLLGLPPLAICYGFGGITSDYLATGVYVLVLTCLQVGALALLCSAFCCTGLGALISSYLLTATFYIGLPMLMLFLELPSKPSQAFLLVPIALFAEGGGRSADLQSALESSVLIFVSIALFIVLAKVFLVSRAFLEPRNRLLSIFRWLDRAFDRVNKAIGGFRFGRDKESLPDGEPIAWREVARRSLGKPLYLFRILVLLEVPTLFIAATAMLQSETHQMRDTLSLLFYGIGVLALLAVSVMGANAVASERMSQTLEVLLTTPIDGSDIVRQKRRGVRRLRRVLLVPLATLLLVQVWWGETGYHGYRYGYYREASPLLRPALLFVAAAIFLILFSWLAFWIALRVKTRFRAIMGTLIALVGWNILPPVLWFLIITSSEVGPGARDRAEDFFPLLHMSPAALVVTVDQGLPEPRRGPDESDHFAMALMFLVVYAVLAAVLRIVCLRRADRYLGRAPGAGPPRPLSAGDVCGILTPVDPPPPRGSR